MKIITSKDNQIYKKALKLTRKKYRDETGLYLLEGVKPLRDAVSMGISLTTVFLREDVETDIDIPEEKIVRLGRDLFDRLSETENSQGVIAAAEKRSFSES